MKRNYLKRLLATALLVTLCLTCLSLPAMAKSKGYNGEDFRAKVITKSATIYQRASTSSLPLAKLKKGAVVKVTGGSGSWARVVRKGVAGYMKLKTLVSDGPLMIGYAKRDAVARMIKGAKGHMVIPKGKTVYVYGKDESGNYLVGDKKMKKLGYVSRSLIKSY